MTAPFDIDKFKSKPAGHVIRSGKRIEVETLEPKKAPKKRKPFKVRWVKTPTEWIRRLKGKGGAAHELALYVLERDFECKHKGGEIILSTTATGLPRQTRADAVKILVDLGLIAVEQHGNQAAKVTHLFFLSTKGSASL
jgi:hypothetical protein